MAERKKTGGRIKGTPNKITAVSKEFISEFLADYKNGNLGKPGVNMKHDFLLLEPMDRLLVAIKLMQHVVPKLANTTVDVLTENRKKSIEETMAELAKMNDTGK